jgi:putative alpha-1,2-mannosidase
VESATWQGLSWDIARAPARALADGGTLRFVLGSRPVTDWATQPGAAPPSYGPVK